MIYFFQLHFIIILLLFYLEINENLKKIAKKLIHREIERTPSAERFHSC